MPLNYTQPPNMLRNPKVHWYIQNNPLLIRISSQISSVHNITSYVFKIQFNIILILSFYS